MVEKNFYKYMSLREADENNEKKSGKNDSVHWDQKLALATATITNHS